MKNPYRSLQHRPLRTLQVCTLLAAMFVKLLPALFLFFNADINPAEIQRFTLIAIALAITCLLDLGTLYSLTLGFNGLLERPWFVLFTPAINALIAAGIGSFYGLATFLTASGDLPWWTGPLRVTLVLAILLAQVTGALILFLRARSDRPFPL
jgi:hypothetical protein